jgi:hypothetical protein
MPASVRSAVTGRNKLGSSLTLDPARFPHLLLDNPVVPTKGRWNFPASGRAFLDNPTAGVKARLSGVPQTPGQRFAQAVATLRADAQNRS